MASTLKTNAIEPEGGTTNLVIGESGQNTVISNNDIRANVLQDAGGNAIFTSDGSGTLSGVSSGLGSSRILLSTQTGTSTSSISFTSLIDSTYGEYIFGFYNINCEGNGPEFDFHVSINGGSSYGVNKTTTFFKAYHNESGASALAYDVDQDVANATASQAITGGQHNAADASMHGELHLWNPSSTTYAKHFYSRTVSLGTGDKAIDTYVGGYINTTDNIDAVKFQFASDDFDGKIKMWGVK